MNPKVRIAKVQKLIAEGSTVAKALAKVKLSPATYYHTLQREKKAAKVAAKAARAAPQLITLEASDSFSPHDRAELIRFLTSALQILAKGI